MRQSASSVQFDRRNPRSKRENKEETERNEVRSMFFKVLTQLLDSPLADLLPLLYRLLQIEPKKRPNCGEALVQLEDIDTFLEKTNQKLGDHFELSSRVAYRARRRYVSRNVFENLSIFFSCFRD